MSNIRCRECYIEHWAFDNCKNLKSINEDFIGSATHIGDGAFYYCNKLALGDVHFSSKIDTIGRMSFEGVTLVSTKNGRV